MPTLNTLAGDQLAVWGKQAEGGQHWLAQEKKNHKLKETLVQFT